MTSDRNPTLAASKIALLYALLSALWILYSDRLVSATAATVEALTVLQLAKGWAFVLGTSVLIFFLIRREMRRVLKAHSETRASETSFKLLVENAPDAIYVQTGGRIAYLNRAALKLFKAASAEQLLGRPMLELIAAPFRSLVAERMRMLNDEKKAVPIRAHVYNRMDGTPVDVEVNAVPFEYQGRDGALVFVRDVTERRLAQEAVRETEARFRTAFENAAVGMALVDADGVYLEANAAMAAMIGYETRELTGRKVADFTHPDDLKRRSRFITDLLDGRLSAGEHERRFIHRNGSTVHTLLWATVQRDEKGRFQYFISLIQNITNRVLAQQEKEKLETQLQHAQKMESLGTLAGGIAHDFNNILGVIIGSSELLTVTDAVEEPARGPLHNILSAALRARDLVRQILAFSRHAQQERIQISLKALIKETFEFMRASLPATIQLNQELDPRVGTIMADPTQMQQILMNLCTNAAHAMEKTGGALRVSLSNATLTEADVRFDSGIEPGAFVKLEVADTGHGIHPSIINRIFDPYFSTKEKGKGTGLGLAVVHGIVKAHGGTITVSSEVGRGTSFQVYLPAMPGHDRPEGRIVTDLPRGTERVLLVDDEKVLADIEKRMLNRLGYQVEIRTSPVEALEAFRADPQKFDLVMTDMTMPQLTGLNLARKILEIRPGMPVILCTGFSEQASEQAALAIGIRKLLLKPLALENLALAVRQALDCGPPVI